MQDLEIKDINRELQDFISKRIQIVPMLYFSQYQTLQDVNFYYNSKFKSGEIDEDGDRKYFFNIVKNPCKIFSKAVDFDTKNIRLLTAGGGNPLKTWFMERDLKYWMRDQQFGKVLNRIFHDLPIFGSCVIKIVDGVPYFVDLRMLVNDQGADSLMESRSIIEMHDYTVPEFRKVARQMKWSDADQKKVIDEYHKMKDQSHIRIYERYGEVADIAPDGSTSWKNKRIFLADVGIDEFDVYGNMVTVHPGVTLALDDWENEELPYYEFHAEKMPGRWLGIGVVETLIEPQIRENELSNVQAKATYWAGLRVFQTRDASINRNLYTDTRNGEIMNVDSEITQIDMSDRNLAFFNEEKQIWLQNRAELTFSYDVISGERLPAGTPLGSAQIAANQTMSYFEQIQENIAMDVKEMLFNDIIPNFEKQNTVEHTLRLVGEDLDTYTALVKNELVIKEIIRQITDGEPFPTNQERDVIALSIEQSIKQHKEKLLTIPRNFYKDVKYDVDIDITGESLDTRVRYATLFAILQAITADPTATTDPVKKKIISKMAEDGGINPNEIFGAEDKKIEEMQPMVSPFNARGIKGSGGGVSAPTGELVGAGEKAI